MTVLRHAIGFMLFASIAASPAQAKPKALEGEPPIVKEAPDEQGQTVYRQVFQIPNRAVNAYTVRTARAFSILGGEGKVFGPGQVKVRCPIGRLGAVRSTSCRYILITGRAVTEQDLANQNLFYFARQIGALPKLEEKFRQVEQTAGKEFLGRNWVLRREVEFVLSLPEYKAPVVDLTKGELVEASQVEFDSRRLRLHYPSRALREEIEGDLKMMCQVQTDLSVICEDQSFDPPEHAEIFMRSRYQKKRRMTFGNARAKPLLKNGESAVGKRFEPTLIYRIRGSAQGTGHS